MLRLAIDTHLITSHFALALLIRRPGGLVVEMSDGTRGYNAERYRLSTFYDLAKSAVIRLAFAAFGETLAPVQLAGGALVVAAVVVLEARPPRAVPAIIDRTPATARTTA